MSTKIYNAYRSSLTDWHDLSVWLNQLRQRMVPLAQQRFNRVIARRIVDALDQQALGDVPDEAATLIEMLDDIRQARQAAALGYRNPDYDHDVEVRLYPQADATYLRMVGEHLHEYQHLIDEAAHLVDFHYQNSTDRPKDIDEEEWQRRAGVWDDIYSNEDVRPFRVELVAWDDYQVDLMAPQSLVSYQRTLQKRAYAQAFRLKMSAAPSNKIGSFALKVKDWLNTEEGLAYVEHIGKQLALCYTSEDFIAAMTA